MISDNVWLVGVAIVVAAGLCLAFERSGNSLLDRVRLRTRRVSSAGTPPPSISKETSSPTLQKYTHVLPPQRRHVLANFNNVVPAAIDEKEVADRILPMDMDYRACTEREYTPTGFSVQEIKELEDFPDYAKLSGVPLPQPYHEFDIDKALPRPYRPFRWSYHQTMCMSAIMSARYR